MKHFLCVLDSPVRPGDRWLWNYLPGNDDQVDFAVAQPPDLFGGIGKAFTRYPGYLFNAHEALQSAKRGQYDALVAWESKNGLPLACLRWLRREDRPPLVLLTFSAKRYVLSLGPIIRRWLKHVDHLTVPSTWEASEYSRAFGLSNTQVSVCHLGAYDLLEALPLAASSLGAPQEDGYLFSGGRTDRDYRTLLGAIAGSGIRTVIATRSYIVQGLQIPREAQINDLLSGAAYAAAVAQAQAVIVPLKQVNHAAGLSLILDAMALGRPVICSDIPAVRDYIADGITGILVPPDNIEALRHAIAALRSDPARREEMGRAARAQYEEEFTFPMFARRVYDILTQLPNQAHY